MKIVLPIPHKCLSPNARSHWAVTMKHKKAARAEAYYQARIGLKTAPPRWTKATVKITWYSKTARHPDADNALASCKAYWDGLQDAGVVANDRGIRYEPIDFQVDRVAPGLVVEIEPT
jgi:crossover junction endodeoxyribonuclease RusA